jgi:V8-like Glu-specific endopeptidase
VARVVLADGSSGSGFLIGNNLLITNNHVLGTKEVARTAHVEFNFQKNALGNDEPVDPYELEPDKVFETSLREEQGGDDWSVVQVKGNPAAKWGVLPLTSAPAGTPKKGEEVIIIQHPGGGQKQIALSHNVIAYADARRLQYMTDTEEGSSGSPVFDIEWKVVALHHKGGWLVEPGIKQKLFRNQGVHINVVIDGLKGKGLL